LGFGIFYCLLSRTFVQSLVDVGDFFDPPLPFWMLHAHDVSARPVEVIGDVGYLLVQAL